jgi:hypothetical protein
MRTKFIEATNVECGGLNWGKFMLARFTPEEWARRSQVGGLTMLHERGWTPRHLIVFDLQTGEGAYFMPGGSAHHDLEKHRIWVCPLFEPFLKCLYAQNTDDLSALPAVVNIDDPKSSLAGYRRPGPQPEPA